MFGNQPYGNPYQLRFQQPPAPAQTYYQPMGAIPQQTASGLIQVNGLEGAKAYPLAPNAEVALFDGGRDVFYLKRTDAGGYPTIEAYQFSQLQETAPVAAAEYVTRKEFEELKEALTNGKHALRTAEPAE